MEELPDRTSTPMALVDGMEKFICLFSLFLSFVETTTVYGGVHQGSCCVVCVSTE